MINEWITGFEGSNVQRPAFAFKGLLLPLDNTTAKFDALVLGIKDSCLAEGERKGAPPSYLCLGFNNRT